jgi:hypothetical protein
MTSGTFSRDDRDYIVEQLRLRVLEVDFTKRDGTNRTMKCTLRGDYLPPAAKPMIDLTKDKSHPQENLDVVSVWDIEAKGWRSFRLDSVNSITIRQSVGLANVVERV